ncbi:acidic amino acid decarboxylase GADL1-like [Palaemon carinicauda]|uniref:acidic amino acid decarboxylase GADL1-like n=1 Tax=Palaemon carinicauda TaxID=392227 RepID=UPI0035B5DE23
MEGNKVKNEKWAEGSLLKKVFDMVFEEKLVFGIDPSKKVLNFKHPKEMEELLQLSISDEGLTAAEAEAVIDKFVKYSVRTQHPYFLNQQFHGIDEVGLAASWLTEALNSNQHTYEISPVFILIEKFVISKMITLFGWSDGDGIFSAGGSLSNTYGMSLARYRHCPDVKSTGLFGRKKLVAFASDQCHYWIHKSASLMGLGLDNVVIVPTDVNGRMIPAALKEAIQKTRDEGRDPFFVAASCGTTVLGSFDPLDEIADICEAEGLWFHADACWGGITVLSKKQRHNMKGMERLDSLAWNPHKMFGTPIQCSPFFTRHRGLLRECNSAQATYLFQQDKVYDVNYDIGDMSSQCGRRADANKMYLMLNFHGLAEIERRIDAAFEASSYFSDKISRREGFRLILKEPQCTNVCFWFIPKSLRGQPETPEWWQKMSKVAPEIKARMMKEGTLMIGYQPLKNKNLVNFFRLLNHCIPTPTKATMDYVVNEIERLGNDL